MLDFGWSEFVLVLVLALVLLGPKEIPEILYWIGRGVRRLQYLRFALSQQFDGFMHHVDLHDLQRPGNMLGGVDLKPPSVSPSLSSKGDPAVHPSAEGADPRASEHDEDSDYYADFPEAAGPADQVSDHVKSSVSR